MSALFWWVVASVLISFVGVPAVALYSRHLFYRGNSDAIARTNDIITVIKEAAGDGETVTFDKEEFLKANKELLDVVADHMFARFNLKDQNTANVLSPQANEARTLVSLLTEVQKDPQAAMNLIGGGRLM